MKEQSRKMVDRIQGDTPQGKYEEAEWLIKKLAQKGNRWRMVFRKPGDQVFMEAPLTVGIVVGGIFLFFAPELLALGSLIALFKQVKAEIVRSDSNK